MMTSLSRVLSVSAVLCGCGGSNSVEAAADASADGAPCVDAAAQIDAALPDAAATPDAREDAARDAGRTPSHSSRFRKSRAR